MAMITHCWWKKKMPEILCFYPHRFHPFMWQRTGTVIGLLVPEIPAVSFVYIHECFRAVQPICVLCNPLIYNIYLQKADVLMYGYVYCCLQVNTSLCPLFYLATMSITVNLAFWSKYLESFLKCLSKISRQLQDESGQIAGNKVLT